MANELYTLLVQSKSLLLCGLILAIDSKCFSTAVIRTENKISVPEWIEYASFFFRLHVSIVHIWNLQIINRAYICFLDAPAQFCTHFGIVPYSLEMSTWIEYNVCIQFIRVSLPVSIDQHRDFVRISFADRSFCWVELSKDNNSLLLVSTFSYPSRQLHQLWFNAGDDIWFGLQNFISRYNHYNWSLIANYYFIDLFLFSCDRV